MRKAISDLYKSQYASVTVDVIQDSEDDEDDLFKHMYKKRRALHNENELDIYLNSEVIPGNVDLLQ